MILVNIESITIGDNDAEGVLFDLTLIPATSNVEWINAVEMAEGMPSFLTHDADGNIWVGEPRWTGITLFDENIDYLDDLTTTQDHAAIAISSEGEIWGVDGELVTQTLYKWASDGSTLLTVTLEDPWTSFGRIIDIDMDHFTDTLYVLLDLGRVLALNSDGDVVRSWGWSGVHPFLFSNPQAITVDQATGDVLVVDEVRIHTFSAAGEPLRCVTVLEDALRVQQSTPGPTATGMTSARHLRRGLRSRHLLGTGTLVHEDMTIDDALPVQDVAVEPVTGDHYVLGTGNPPIQVFSEAGHWRRGVGDWRSRLGYITPTAARLVIVNNRLYVVDLNRLQVFALQNQVREAMPDGAAYALRTDGGMSPTGYWRLIMDDVRGYLATEFELDVPESEIVILGWNDARFYGTSAYEEFDDFLSSPRGTANATFVTGRFAWESTMAYLVAGTFSLGTAVKQADDPLHAGVVRFSSGRNTNAAFAGFCHLLHLPEVIYPPRLPHVSFIGRLVSNRLFSELFMGLAGSGLTVASPMVGHPALGLIANSAHTNWRIIVKNGTTTSYTNTGIPVISEDWVKLSIDIVDVVSAGSSVEIDYRITLEDLVNGTIFTHDLTFGPTSSFAWSPSFGIAQFSGTAEAYMDIDYCDFRVEDLVRVQAEY